MSATLLGLLGLLRVRSYLPPAAVIFEYEYEYYQVLLFVPVPLLETCDKDDVRAAHKNTHERHCRPILLSVVHSKLARLPRIVRIYLSINYIH